MIAGPFKASVALVHEIHHDETLHDEALHHDSGPGTPARPRAADGTPSYCEIAPAAGDAAAIFHLRQASFENVAADIVEIDIDAIRCRGPPRP